MLNKAESREQGAVRLSMKGRRGKALVRGGEIVLSNRMENRQPSSLRWEACGRLLRAPGPSPTDGMWSPASGRPSPAKAECARPKGLHGRSRLGRVVWCRRVHRHVCETRRNPKGNGSSSPTTTTTKSSLLGVTGPPGRGAGHRVGIQNLPAGGPPTEYRIPNTRVRDKWMHACLSF